MESSSVKTLSIVIPIYNEQEILRESVDELVAGVRVLGHSFELLLAENGSTDATIAIATELAQEYEEVQTFSASEPNYGLALREGILKAKGDIVICDEIDLCDLDFYQRAVDLLFGHEAQFVVGSKAMRGAHDERPLFRQFATRVMNGMLRVAVDFRGTDTHGLKAFNRQAVVPVVHQCIIDGDIFASELVVRAGRTGIDVVEIPVVVNEKRRPAINLARRVPGVLKNMAQLTYAIRFHRG